MVYFLHSVASDAFKSKWGLVTPVLRPFRPLTVLSEEEATVIRMAYKAQDKVGPTYLYAFIILSLLQSTVPTLALTLLKYAKHVPTSGPLLFLCPLSGMLLTSLINIYSYDLILSQELLH